MKFEKISENKLRITLNIKDLKDRDIDFSNFMADSLETQNLVLDILEEANRKLGFNTNNYRLKIEALAMVDGDFIVNITRIPHKVERNPILATSRSRRKFTVQKKKKLNKSENSIYKFDNFDDYYHFIQFLFENNLSDSVKAAKNILVYLYKEQYYLVFRKINVNYTNSLNFYTAITEFGTYINNSDLFLSKLSEYGNIVIKHNALRNSLKHFGKKTEKKL